MTWTILTGGQTGVDTGALMAARDLGLPWKAIFPFGWRREKPIPEWMKEHAQELQTSSNYDDRTRYCVQQATEVMCFGTHLNTPGTQLTLALAGHYGRPIWKAHTWYGPKRWLQHGVLMVAGPRASKWDGGAEVAYRTITTMFSDWKKFTQNNLPLLDVDLAD